MVLERQIYRSVVEPEAGFNVLNFEILRLSLALPHDLRDVDAGL